MGQCVQKPNTAWKTEFSSKGSTKEPNGANLFERPVLMAGSLRLPQSSHSSLSAGECVSLRPFSNPTVVTLIQCPS